jgi:hypothetical protein
MYQHQAKILPMVSRLQSSIGLTRTAGSVIPWRNQARIEARGPDAASTGTVPQELPMLAWPWDLFR